MDEPAGEVSHSAPVIIVGLNGSDPAEAACGWAAWFCRSMGGQLVAASAWLPHQAEGTPTDIESRREDAAKVLDVEWSAPARAVGIEPRILQVEGPPEALLDMAEDVEADLIVVGNHGGGGHAALHIGSVAHHLAHHTMRPLAIIPAPAARRRPGVIALGVNGSLGSEGAVGWCRAVGPALSASVEAVTAFEPFAEWLPTSEPDSWYQSLRQDAAQWVRPLEQAGVHVRTRVKRDIHPAAAIAQTAKEVGAQLIVVGAPGLNSLTHSRSGVVALQLVHQAELPVVLVPPTWQPPGAPWVAAS